MAFFRLSLPRLRSSVALGASVIALGLVCGAEGSALAADAPQPLVYPTGSCVVTEESAAAARGAIALGKSFSDEGNYDEAVRSFLIAYKKDCERHTFLPLLAGVLEKQSNYEEAIRALKLYLERQRDISVGDRTTIESKIKNLQALRDKQKKAIADAAAAAAAQQPSAPPREVVVREHTAAPWVVFGVGVAALGTGIVLAAAGPAIPKLCDGAADGTVSKDVNGKPACLPDPAQPPASQESERQSRANDAGLARGLQIAAPITIIGGAVLMVGGLAWHFLEPTGPVTKEGKLRPKVTPQVSPGYAGLSLGGAF
jgi:tetratricopeptide (TPR) repeat protein